MATRTKNILEDGCPSPTLLVQIMSIREWQLLVSILFKKCNFSHIQNSQSCYIGRRIWNNKKWWVSIQGSDKIQDAIIMTYPYSILIRARFSTYYISRLILKGMIHCYIRKTISSKASICYVLKLVLISTKTIFLFFFSITG